MNRSSRVAGVAGLIVVVAMVSLVWWSGRGGDADASRVVAVTVTVVAGTPVEPQRVTVREGQLVSLRVTTYRVDELHLHGYDLSIELEPDQPGTLEFIADKTGRFEFELEEEGVSLGVIEVSPR